MESHFILTTLSGCKIQIVDQTEYPAQSTIDSYSFEDSISLNILLSNSLKEQKIIDKEILVHKDYCNKQFTVDGDTFTSKDISEFQLSNDGKFTAMHIILPTKEWVDKFTKEELLAKYPYLFYYDNGIHKSLNGGLTSEIVDSELLLQINTTGTNLFKCKRSTFSICFLFRCYINYCKRVLDQQISKCINKDKDLLFKRDFVWMTINVIKYYIELGQLDEAQRLLEETMSCNGFCKSNMVNYSLTNNTVSGCGCGA